MDPSRPVTAPKPSILASDPSEVTLEQLLERQLGIADTLQQILITQRDGMDFKDVQ